MKLNDVKRLIQVAGESGTVELKRSTANLKSAAQTLCAFLNGQGGIVFIGIANNHKITGQVVSDKTKLDISNMLKKFEPTANIEIDYIDVQKGNQVIALTAHPDSRCVPYSFSGCPYERQEADTHVMSQTRYQQLLLMRNMTPISWETQLAHSFSIDDLDKDEIVRTVKAGIVENHIDSSLDVDDMQMVLTKLGLLKNAQLINAGVVLFAKEPGNEYMQCVLRMARFKGFKKDNFIDSKHVFGNAFYLLHEAEKFIRRNTAIASRIKKGQMKRIDEPEYPFEAIREGLVNALCHRDYASPGGAITLAIYDDRLEIINTGLLPDGITLAQLKETHTSHPRNPNIINVFYRRGLIEAMGMGTQKIIQVCTNANMKEPEFFEQAGTFALRLWSRSFKDYSDDINLSERQKNILVLLKNNPLSPKDLLSLLKEDITDRTLRSDLQMLKDKGYANTTGQGKQTLWSISPNIKTRK